MTVSVTEVDSIFAAALELSSPEERAEYVRRVCGEYVELRQRVNELLMAHFEAGDFLERLPATVLYGGHEDVQAGPGTVIGPYKLLQQIGEGGMGVVFMAEQTEPIHRTVAVKIIKPGMDTRQVIARFEAERQALAMMDHPSIAKVLDAGTTETGRPFFVMELVKGVPVTEYCDRQHLSIRQRLELMTQVCHAVQHAHQKGIIHRDLKPSNVLVAEYDGQPVPKVIDFGVAKATAQKLTERTMFTEYGQLIGTFEYMSPEQARFNQLDIDTRSDIYSLGVLLYELMTGTTPLEKERLRSAAFDEILRIISEEEPPRPSTRLSSSEALPSIAANRSLEPKKLSGLIRGELDWIAIKCLEKDRNRRYETASALAADLAHYLADEPVQACSPSVAYRLRKFVRRNKAGVMVAGSMVAALLLGLAFASIGFVQAQRQAENAKDEAARSDQTAQFLTEMLSAVRPGVARGRDTALLREILDKASDRVNKDLSGQPEVQGELLTTLAGTFEALDDSEEAVRLYQQTVDCYRRAGGQEGVKLAIALCDLGASQTLAGIEGDGRKNAQLGLAIARRIGDPATFALCFERAARSVGLPGGHTSIDGAAIPYLEEAIALRRRADDPVALAQDLAFLAKERSRSSGVGPIGRIDVDKAEALVREALQFHQKSLDKDDPIVGDDLLILGEVLAMQGNYVAAITVLHNVQARFQNIYPTGHAKLLMPVLALSDCLLESGSLEEADRLAEEGLQVRREMYGPRLRDTLSFINLKARILRVQGKTAEAARLHEQAEKSAREHLSQLDFLRADITEDLAYIRRLQGRYDESLAVYDELIAVIKRVNPNSGRLLRLQAGRKEAADLAAQPFMINRGEALAYISQGDFKNARMRIDEAIDVLPADEWNGRNQIAWILATGSTEELRDGPLALKLALRAAEITNFQHASTLDTLAAAYAETGDFDSAIKYARKALDLATALQKERFESRLEAYRNKERWWLEK